MPPLHIRIPPPQPGDEREAYTCTTYTSKDLPREELIQQLDGDPSNSPTTNRNHLILSTGMI